MYTWDFQVFKETKQQIITIIKTAYYKFNKKSFRTVHQMNAKKFYFI
jgi:hypothetical protein